MDPALVLALVVLDIAAVCLYVFLLTRMDRYRMDKESATLIMRFYFIGLLSNITVWALYLTVGRAIAGLFWALMEGPGFYVGSFVEQFFIVGPVEETAKFLVFFLFSSWLRTIKEPVDGILQAAAVGLAFASVENMEYALHLGVSNMLVRSVLCILGHMTLSAMWGFACSKVVYHRLMRNGRPQAEIILKAIALAAATHGTYNFLLDLGRFDLAVMLIVFALAGVILLYGRMIEESPYRAMPRWRYREAIRTVRAALASNPRNFVLNRRLALYLLYGGAYREALGRFERCRALRPRNPYMRCFCGLVRLLSGGTEEARAKGRTVFREAFERIDAAGRRKLWRTIRRWLPKDESRNLLLREMEACGYQDPSRLERRRYNIPAPVGTVARRTTPRRRYRPATQTVYRSRAIDRSGKPYRQVLAEKTEELRAALKHAG